jgi:hypothetical protein
MAIFRKVNTMPAAAVHEQINAAAGVAGNPNVNNFIAYQSGFDRANAMLSPTISRSRDLICSMVGALSIGQYSLQWTGEDLEEMAIPPRCVDAATRPQHYAQLDFKPNHR